MREEHDEGRTAEKMGESDLGGMTLQCNSWSQGNKPGTAGPHIAAANEWRKNVWKD